MKGGEEMEEMVLMESKYCIGDSLRNASAIDESFANIDFHNRKILNTLITEAIKA